MLSRYLRLPLLLFTTLTVCQVYETTEILLDESKHDEQFFTFRSRPDIEAPRWNYTVYDEEALAPGYWFVAPYGVVEQQDNNHAYVAPSIYDSRDGELVWNGVDIFRGFNTFTFRVSRLHGHDVLTALHQRQQNGVIINGKYIVHRHVPAGDNIHEFQISDEGEALYLTNQVKRASREQSVAVEFDGQCMTRFSGFQERSIGDGKIIFDWSAENKIALDESYVYRGEDTGTGRNTPNRDCPDRGWDYLHLNSIEKLPDGDYLVSGRRTYAVYKISHENGSILWRLGGKKSDFRLEEGTHFTGQHDARCLMQNKTHMILSMMDNAVGPQGMDKSNANSRGLVIAVDTETMTAREIARYDHPYGIGSYASERGNFQFLPNGNAFVSWTESALHSEHAANGKVIAKANLPSGLKTYRTYKFPWIGKPQLPPDVFSQVFYADNERGFRTVVSVSWNGDTRAAKWNLFKTNEDGTRKEFLGSKRRTGFETTIVSMGYAFYIMVDAEDSDGKKLENSESHVTRTVAMIDSAESILDMTVESAWQDLFRSPLVTFLAGVLLCAVATVVFQLTWRRWGHDAFAWAHRTPEYAAINNEDLESEYSKTALLNEAGTGTHSRET